jgi:hypothetical protein
VVHTPKGRDSSLVFILIFTFAPPAPASQPLSPFAFVLFFFVFSLASARLRAEGKVKSKGVVRARGSLAKARGIKIRTEATFALIILIPLAFVMLEQRSK